MKFLKKCQKNFYGLFDRLKKKHTKNHYTICILFYEAPSKNATRNHKGMPPYENRSKSEWYFFLSIPKMRKSVILEKCKGLKFPTTAMTPNEELTENWRI